MLLFNLTGPVCLETVIHICYSGYMDEIEAIAALSNALGGASVALLATTTDGMGLTGEGKGIAAIASASIFKDSTHSR